MSKVLILDDEPQYGVYLRDWLTREGHEVKTATTAEDAIQFGTHWLPSVLVADWMLPSPMDGLQVSEAVRAANPELQTILITGYPSKELKARAAQAKVFSFIEKPFSLTEVAGAVREAANAGRPLLPGNVLVVSQSPTVGKLAADALRAASYEHRVAATAQEALLALREDSQISIAILDGLTATIDMGILAAELRALRPDLIVVGSSEDASESAFAELDIDRFLPRFWDCNDLHKLLIERIAACTECGLPLPLRRPFSQETPRSWECAMCGARYQAILLADAQEDLRRHVRGK